MTADAGKWTDLSTRLVSGTVLVVVGVTGIWIGGHVFHGLIALVCGMMSRELVRMLVPDRRGLALQLGAAAGGAVLLATYVPVFYAMPILAAGVLVGVGQVKHPRYFLFISLVLLAGWGMAHVRDDLGVNWMIWLVMIVVITDVAGYFAGRMIGGPKFWPSLSPKKTWAGTLAGWLASAAIGIGFGVGGHMMALLLASVFLSLASQMGDIAESAMKRRAGVKDSSRLIPGHGGLLDRFDGMMGAALALLVLEVFFGFPWN